MTYFAAHLGLVGARTLEHLALTFVSLALACAIAFPLALLVTRDRRVGSAVMGLLGTIYTIPSLALFALLVPFEGLGFWTAVTALVAYAQMILVRNIATALAGVDPALLEAARGMGMTPAQVLRRVTLPVALPGILAGLRIATVSVIAIATVAAFINAGGLGTFLFEGLQAGNGALILTGSIASAALAIAADVVLRRAELAVRR